jgi:hypothetical protein
MGSGGGELLPADDELPGHEDGGEGGEAGPAGAALLLREDRLQRPQRQVKEYKPGRTNVLLTFRSKLILIRGRIIGRNWDKSLKSFPPCYSQSPLLMDFTPHPRNKKRFETSL